MNIFKYNNNENKTYNVGDIVIIDGDYYQIKDGDCAECDFFHDEIDLNAPCTSPYFCGDIIKDFGHARFKFIERKKGGW